MTLYRKFVFTILSLFLCAASLAGCDKTKDAPGGGEARKAVYTKISPKQAKDMMDKGGQYIILDVRTQEEFREQRINGAQLIPVNEISSRAAKELPDKDAVIFVYCRSGSRSSSAAHQLVSMGYTNVYDIGGIMSWPYETVNG